MTLQNALGSLALDATVAQLVAELTGTLSVADAPTLAKLEAIRVLLAGGTPVSVSNEVEVKNDAGNPLSVSVAAFPTVQPVSGTVSTGLAQPLTRTQLDATVVAVGDDYLTGTIAAAQNGTGAVLTFALAQYVDLLWVRDVGSTATNVCWADPFGGTPSNGVGIPVPNGEPVPITVRTQSVKVWAPAGSTIAVYGYGR